VDDGSGAVWIDRRIVLAFIAALGLVFVVMMEIALRY
jgi:hypothetical protein